MNTIHLRQLFVALLLISGLWSCNDHLIPITPPGAANLRIKKITSYREPATIYTPGGSYVEPIIASVSLLRYDAQGRLSAVFSYQTPDSTLGQVEQSTYTYDAQNRLTRLTHEVIRRSGISPNPVETYTYSYNGAGRVAFVLYKNNLAKNKDIDVTETPKYDATNRVVGSVVAFRNGLTTSYVGEEYQYTGNNVTRSRSVNSNNPDPVFTANEIFSNLLYYDTGLNPFYGTPVVLNPKRLQNELTPSSYTRVVSNQFDLSQNLFFTISGGRNLIDYTFNGSNLPLTRRAYTIGVQLGDIRQYEYESY